jgi:hypothetical protein
MGQSLRRANKSDGNTESKFNSAATTFLMPSTPFFSQMAALVEQPY